MENTEKTENAAIGENRLPRITATFERDEQTKRQTEEWKKLILTVPVFTPKTIAYCIVGVIALALAVVFFVLTSDENTHFGTAAVICSVIAALGIASGVTDAVLAYKKRKKAIPRLTEHLEKMYDGLSSPCPFVAEFDDDVVRVAVGEGAEVRRADVPLSDCSAVEFDGMVMFDLGRFFGICLTFDEIGDDTGELRDLLSRNGESYRYLESDGSGMRLWEK